MPNPPEPTRAPMTDAEREAREAVDDIVADLTNTTDRTRWSVIGKMEHEYREALDAYRTAVRHAALAEARAIVRQVPPRQPKDSSVSPEEMGYATLAEDFRSDILDVLEECK